MTASSASEIYSTDLLLTGSDPIVTQGETVAAGQNLAAHTVVARLTADGTIKAHAPAASDGTQLAIGILVNAVNAVSATKAPIYVAGTFNPDLLVWNAATDTDAKKAVVFDRTPIHLRKPA